jgi:hypothetical protein
MWGVSFAAHKAKPGMSTSLLTRSLGDRSSIVHDALLQQVPQFLIVGVPKSGTSALYHGLCGESHFDKLSSCVLLCDKKENHQCMPSIVRHLAAQHGTSCVPSLHCWSSHATGALHRTCGIADAVILLMRRSVGIRTRYIQR